MGMNLFLRQLVVSQRLEVCDVMVCTHQRIQHTEYPYSLHESANYVKQVVSLLRTTFISVKFDRQCHACNCDASFGPTIQLG